MEWIKVKDEMPEECEIVLCYCKDDSFFTGYIDTSGKWTTERGDVIEPVYWQDLPEKPI